eukprot:2394792-Prymnesium_polylepis.2
MADKNMGDLSNRLPWMSLDQICRENDFAYACVWRPWAAPSGKTELKIDALSVRRSWPVATVS